MGGDEAARWTARVGSGWFISSGWSGEGARDVHEILVKTGFEMICEPYRQAWVPTDKELADCFELGQKLAASIK